MLENYWIRVVCQGEPDQKVIHTWFDSLKEEWEALNYSLWDETWDGTLESLGFWVRALTLPFDTPISFNDFVKKFPPPDIPWGVILKQLQIKDLIFAGGYENDSLHPSYHSHSNRVELYISPSQITPAQKLEYLKKYTHALKLPPQKINFCL